jgi:hypothetical protein
MTYGMPEVSLLGRAEELVQFWGWGPYLEPDFVTPTWHIYSGPSQTTNNG